MKRIDIRLTPEEKAGLREIARSEGISTSAVVRGAVDIILKEKRSVDPTLQANSLSPAEPNRD